MHNIKRVRPHVALGPPLCGARPGPVRIARLHEPGLAVEERERRREGARAEERGFGGGFVERGGERGHGVVVVCDRIYVSAGKVGGWEDKNGERGKGEDAQA